MEVRVYGSAHCVTSLKAKQWLEYHQLPYQSIDLEEHDLNTEGAEELCSFKEVQVKQLFVTWSEAFHSIAIDLSYVGEKQLIFLCTQHTKLLRRPLITIDEALFTGYNGQLMEQLILDKQSLPVLIKFLNASYS